MQSPKIQVKYFTQEPVELEHFVPVFHRWIRDRVLDDMVIDVADYAHVHHGPGIVLIGNAVDYFMDQGEGRLGLLYSRKRDPLAPEERVLDGFKKALNACRLLEQEPGLGVKFRTDEVLVRLPDRLTAPNTDEGFAALKGALEPVVTKLYGDSARIEKGGDKGAPLSARIQAQSPASISDLLGRL
ncbi:MAG TPA: hypothetical protein VM686_16910 [Polyangiaceae bacterium]|jgi:hypothetical protein|nr:hypothetical protein [Polyangiaceae bacterium]